MTRFVHLPRGLLWCSLATAMVVLTAGSPDLRAVSPGRAEHPAAGEYDVKAAFLFNFLKFVDWPRPASAVAPLRVLVVGRDPFGPVLDKTVAGRTAGGRSIVILRQPDAGGAHDIQLLFLGDIGEERTRDALKWARGRPILTVGEHEQFLRLGGAIRLKVVNRHVRFDVNVETVEAAGLKIKRSLLQVADTVVWPPGE